MRGPDTRDLPGDQEARARVLDTSEVATASGDGEHADAARWILMSRFRDALLTRLLIQHLRLTFEQARGVWFDAFAAEGLREAAASLPPDVATELVVLRAVCQRLRTDPSPLIPHLGALALFLHDELGLSVTSCAVALECDEAEVVAYLEDEAGASHRFSTSA